MTRDGLRVAIAEAERFIGRARTALASAGNPKYENDSDLDASKENAAAKRASLDLTRALAMMRKVQR